MGSAQIQINCVDSSDGWLTMFPFSNMAFKNERDTMTRVFHFKVEAEKVCFKVYVHVKLFSSGIQIWQCYCLLELS